MPFQILIVEDEIAIRFIYERICKSIDCDFVSVSDGEAAIQFLQDQTPSFIILDMLLPKVGGEEVLAFMADNLPRFQQTHVVIVSSAQRFEQCVDRVPSAQFILKPFVFRDIQSIIEECMSRVP